MTDLVIMKDRQAVTSSLQVAENFEKRHDNTLRDIDQLKKDVLNFEEMFFEVLEKDSYGRERRVIYMNRDGFTILAMGFTGKKALQFKLKYIEAFNQMEKHIKSKQHTKNINSGLEEIKRMNAQARVMNATSRQAKLLMDMAKDTTSEVNKALLQDKAVEVLNGENLLEMPTLRQHLFDSDQIAKKVGVYSKSGKPHGTAVSQLIKQEIFIEEGESEIVPEATNHWGGSVTKYAESVIDKVEAWLETNGYPSRIKGSKKDYHVQYEF
ncbi:Rha family transcriptional regulator [Enterococcus raffinosus]|uniref:Rha family transcriptional regulator n=1 Tax=Enterococcus TaxID=1350 RepID=UPI0028907D36|nr:Rha family transcriptional regulator [Enterococcus raffinosus]MDT2580047.1 Rha family transcriptional regulator [Enterococcus raffinosus]